MTSSGGKPTGLVADADVLIDYAESDKTILALISIHFAPVYIPLPVLDDEVGSLTRDDVRQLGIEVIEPTLAQAIDAEKNIGATSLNDNFCMILARDNNWAVLTNDNALRKICKALGVNCVWGLEAMVMLVERSYLNPKDASSVAEAIVAKNPRMPKKLLMRFKNKIGME